MDNLTHSLVGALLGQMGLKRKTGLAMPTLIIAANIPDIDAVTVLLGGQQHLALRRGITHGPIAMVLLPLLLWGAMLWFDRWQTQRGKRPEKRLPINKSWLLGLAYIGCLSHLLFDWFNSYGVRLLEPFSSQWFYGDTLFIIDVWIWTALVAGVCLSWRWEKNNRNNWQTPARVTFLAISAYIFGNGTITAVAEHAALVRLTAGQSVLMGSTLVVANPKPVLFWEREILWRNGGGRFGKGTYALSDGLKLDLTASARNCWHCPGFPVQNAALQNADLRAFLFWSRMPVAKFRGKGSKRRLEISDQRFNNPLVADRFTIRVLLPSHRQ